MSVLTILAVIAALIYIIARQLLGEPIRSKRLIILPAVLTLIGAVDLAKHTPHPTGTDITLIATGAVIAAGIGLAQGRAMRLQGRDGGLWGQLPLQALWLWALLYVSRGGLIGIAHATNAHVAAGTQSELLILGINRLGQAAIVAWRAITAGIPLTPEKDDGQPKPTALTPAASADPTASDSYAHPPGTELSDDPSAAPAHPPAPTSDESMPGAGPDDTRLKWSNLARQLGDAGSRAADSRNPHRHVKRAARRAARKNRRS